MESPATASCGPAPVPRKDGEIQPWRVDRPRLQRRKPKNVEKAGETGKGSLPSLVGSPIQKGNSDPFTALQSPWTLLRTESSPGSAITSTSTVPVRENVFDCPRLLHNALGPGQLRRCSRRLFRTLTWPQSASSWHDVLRAMSFTALGYT